MSVDSRPALVGSKRMRSLVGWLVIASLCASLACRREVSPPITAEPARPSPPPAPLFVEAATPPCIARTSPGATLLVPDAAQWLFVTDTQALAASPTWQFFATKLAREPNWQFAEGVFESCNMTMLGFDRLVVGVDPETEDFVAILAGQRIGEPERAQCLITAIQRANGDEVAAEVSRMKGEIGLPIIQFTDGRAYLFADDMLALSTTGWEDEVARLSRCEGVGAVQRGLADPLRHVSQDAPLWLVGRPRLVAESAIVSMSPRLLGLRTLALELTFADGLALVAHADLGERAQALALFDELTGTVQSFASADAAWAAMMKRVQMSVEGTSLTLGASLSLDELRALQPD